MSEANRWPSFAEDERRAVERVLQSGRVNYWTGSEGRRFEQEFATYVGVAHGVAVANGTVALELALRATGIGPGAEVIVPCRTFVGTATAVVMCGAVPVFADVDAHSQNVTVATIARALTPRVRAIVPVHLGGWPCDMEAIMQFARQRDLVVVEDCAQAHGATLCGRQVGSFGHAAAFSFCQDKIISTGGEGGMVVTNDEPVWRRAWAMKDHGKSYEAVSRPAARPGFRWLHESFGTNWRMTEMQAAIGRIQLTKLPGWLERRRAHAAQLRERLGRWPALCVTDPPGQVGHAYYRYYAFVRRKGPSPGWNRDRILEAVKVAGVHCMVGSCGEVYLEKAFRAAGLAPDGRLPNARDLADTSLAFTVHPTLSSEEIASTCDCIDEVMRSASS